MTLSACLFANTIRYPKAGGHFWVYLNWALGLRSLGCGVIWLEKIGPRTPLERARSQLSILKSRLQRYGFGDQVALCSTTSAPLPPDITDDCLNLDAAAEADLLLDLAYATSPEMVRRFRRSALVDIDPGLTQVWLSKGQINIAPHDLYFSIGETVGQPNARFPDCGLKWHYTPPCVALDWWPVCPAPANAPFTTVSNWYIDEWIEDVDGWYINDKRSGFLPFLELPKQTNQSLELALCLKKDETEGWVTLPEQGWKVRDAFEVTSTPQDYQQYIQNSRGEFSCVKPSCIRLQNAWISDRTLCYLASGKPAVVQHTGPSRFLPHDAGLFRFQNMEEATRWLAVASADYENQSALARALAEEYFDAKKIVKSVLERAMP